jgi:hypothetical protein
LGRAAGGKKGVQTVRDLVLGVLVQVAVSIECERHRGVACPDRNLQHRLVDASADLRAGLQIGGVAAAGEPDGEDEGLLPAWPPIGARRAENRSAVIPILIGIRRIAAEDETVRQHREREVRL